MREIGGYPPSSRSIPERPTMPHAHQLSCKSAWERHSPEWRFEGRRSPGWRIGGRHRRRSRDSSRRTRRMEQSWRSRDESSGGTGGTAWWCGKGNGGDRNRAEGCAIVAGKERTRRRGHGGTPGVGRLDSSGGGAGPRRPRELDIRRRGKLHVEFDNDSLPVFMEHFSGADGHGTPLSGPPVPGTKAGSYKYKL